MSKGAAIYLAAQARMRRMLDLDDGGNSTSAQMQMAEVKLATALEDLIGCTYEEMTRVQVKAMLCKFPVVSVILGAKVSAEIIDHLTVSFMLGACARENMLTSENREGGN